MFDFNNIDKGELISRADGFYNKIDAAEYLDERIDEFKDLIESGNSVRLYRIVFAEHVAEINQDNLGNHWCDEEDLINQDHMVDYLKYECSGETIDGDVFLLETEFSLSDIDFNMTIAQNLLNPTEHEIYIKSGSKPTGTLWVENLTQESAQEDIIDAITNPQRPIFENKLADDIHKLMIKYNMSDDEYMSITSGIDWHSSNYETKEDYIKEIEGAIFFRKAAFNGGKKTLPGLVDSIMRVYKLDEDGFFEAHSRVDWHDSNADTVRLFVKEIELSIRSVSESIMEIS